jgi:hypothetical protein
MKQAELKGVAEQYAAYATDQARGSSEAYEKLALAVAHCDDLLEFIATLPASAESLFCSGSPRLWHSPEC